ncbi:polysaccharide deacetylase family protein [Asanoa sp. NPDC050611]|uniref:polysaccharide deacetylase family protein n=1 Tax=Asanoa sp. NPDC050611 TaxID=3157098 RepID=UPI0033C8A4CB
MPAIRARRLVALLAVLALSGCATHAKAFTRITSVPTPDAASQSGSPSPSPTAKPPPPRFKSLEWYLARVPQFPPAPVPRLRAGATTERPPFWLRVPTDQKVAFITIDDGALARPADVPAFIREAHIPVTMFLNSPAATEHTDYFKQIEAAGGVVENHTITHRSLRGLSHSTQHHEICGSADKLRQLFGKRPTLFRPPFGDHDDTTMAVARDCGAKAVYYWSATVNEGIVRYQTPTKLLQPGDILLMHFRPALMDDLLGALKAIRKAGLTPALLEDYVPGAGVAPVTTTPTAHAPS